MKTTNVTTTRIYILQKPFEVYFFKSSIVIICNFQTSDLQFNSTLHFIRIFFDTSNFVRIIKGSLIFHILCLFYSKFQDRKAKFVDMVSAVGGTMGLLTGFSLISGVELLYFIAKAVFDYNGTVNGRK